MKKYFLIFIFFIINLINFSYSWFLPNSIIEVDLNEKNIMQKLMNILISSSSLQNANFSINIPFQWWFVDWSPIQNLCKVINNPDYLDKYNLYTATCPSWTETLPIEIGFYTVEKKIHCWIPIDWTILTKFIPKLKINISGYCEWWNICKWYEPWYKQWKNIVIDIYWKPWSGNLTIWWITKLYVDPLWKDTLKIYVNNYIINPNLSGELGKWYENVWTKLATITLDGSGGVKWHLWINYITVQVCDRPIDDYTGKPVQSPDQTYKLNCNTKTFVVKISPTDKNNATSFSYLNQKLVNCADYGYTLPANWKRLFPVQPDGSFYQTCDENWNCTPKAETVCNWTCEEWYIKDNYWPDWLACYPEEKLFDCNNSSIWKLGKNEIWIKPDWFSGKQNVNPSTWQFYGIYNLDVHNYIPNLTYCAKWCAPNYAKGEDWTCRPLTKTIKCINYNNTDDWNLKKYNAQLIINNQDPDYKNYTINQTYDSSNDLDGIINPEDYTPSETLLKDQTNDSNPCKIVLVPNAIQTTDWITCKKWYVGIDTNKDWIIGSCLSYDKSKQYVVFYVSHLDNSKTIKDKIKDGDIKWNLIVSSDSFDLSKCTKIFKDIQYKYSQNLINACIIEKK